ncbi:ABC transporter ATP-binding protein [Glaciihabitans sp. INWT7]|uniref:ABC transporter ATP-binding protein n=1 Tax=Glaciihabitans sp. INWT7 TaxID=2596912 RepID=UPI0021048330|nr:ATP-binding cassette domain-containing protein [Glaciihabitans sp. INWT7]
MKDVSFDLRRGEIVGLVGESGSGKSTIARILARLEQPSAGEILFEGEDLLKYERRGASRSYRRRVQMVFQDPFASLNPAKRVEQILQRPLVVHRKASGRTEVHERIIQIMDTVGLSENMLWSFPHELSGGQRQRVAIARVLAVDPEIILADEPTSMLDVSVRIGILNLIRQICTERSISMLYITHDLASARYIADTTIVMLDGRLIEGGESLELMTNPMHPYTRRLLAAVPDPRKDLSLVPNFHSAPGWRGAPTQLQWFSSAHWASMPSSTLRTSR